MLETRILYTDGHKRVLQPIGQQEVFWLELSNAGPEHGFEPEVNRAACVFSAYLFDQLASSDFWRNLPTSAAPPHYRADWLDRRFDHLTFSHVLVEHGLPTNFQMPVDGDGQPLTLGQAANAREPVYLQVTAAELPALEPVNVNSQTVYFYRPATESKLRMVPLKIRYFLDLDADDEDTPAARLAADPRYALRLGLEGLPRGSQLERPVLEFFTSEENPRRLVSVQEALLLSALTPGQFEELAEMSYLTALGLANIFDQRSIELSNGYLEYSIGREGLMLSGALSFQEMRLRYRGVGINNRLHSPRWAGSLANRLTGEDYFAAPGFDELIAGGLHN